MSVRAPLGDISEAAWQEQVVRLAQLYGWLVYHTFDSRRSTAGFPDLVLVHPRRGRVIFAELKTDKGTLSAPQIEWNAALQQVAATLRAPEFAVYVWRPKDFEDMHAALRPGTAMAA